MIIELFSRPGCHLCDDAKAVLLDAATTHRFELVEHNVEDRAEWEAAYGQEIPVVLINGRKAFKYKVSRTALERYFRR